MILYADFHDYCDKAIGFGIDEKVHYNRYTKEIDILLQTKNDRPSHHNAGLIGFCGNIFPYIKLHKLDKRFCYSYGEDRPKVVEICFAFSFETYKEKEADWHNFSNDFGYRDRIRDTKLKQFFIDWATQSDSVFREQKIPIWVMRFNSGNEKNGIANPKLKDYQFERIKDATTAFQEISIYLANILVEQKPIAVVEDKYRIQQHGFDLKESFRNTKRRKDLD
jgi:hypothetical protein